MGNSDTLRNLLIAGAVFILIMAIMPRPLPPDPNASSNPGGQTTVEGPAGQTQPADSTTLPSGGDSVAGAWSVLQAESSQSVIMGSALSPAGRNGSEDPYRMRLVLSSAGASIESATMTDHAETVDAEDRYTLLAPVEQLDGEPHRSLAIEKINIDGTILSLADKNWNMDPLADSETGQAVSFWIDIQKDGQPVLRLRRSFELARQELKQGTHDVQARLDIENLSSNSHKVIVTYRGGVGVRPTPGSRMVSRIVDWGTFDGLEGSRVEGNRKGQGDVAKTPGEPLLLFEPSTAAPKMTLSWVATANTYFTCTIAPLTVDGQGNPKTLANVSAVDLDGIAETEEDLTLRFVTRAQVIDANTTMSYPLDVYLGEKDHSAFREVPRYLARNYYYQIAQGFGFCTFTWLVDLMIRMLNGLQFFFRDFGIAIIILVLIVRALLHPITKKGQVNMVRMQHKMQEMAPKIEELKKKYANDKQRLNQEMMKLNINPAGQMLTCLPMFIQMPIWVALFLSLSNNIDMRHEPFIISWVGDLTAPDALYRFSSPFRIPLFGWEIASFNLLPILVSIFMYVQQKMQPKPAPNPNMTEQQKAQQDMMKMMMPMMSIMMLLFFYKAPSGLNLYILFSSVFGTIEQYYIRKHIKHHEEAGTLHKPEKKNKDGTPKKPKMPGFMERLQKMADEAQKAQSQQANGKRKGRK